MGDHYKACYNSRGYAKSVNKVVSVIGDCHDCIVILIFFLLL